MIRFLQKDNRVVKAMFVVIIAAASVSMVVYLIPGLTGQSAVSADTYAVIYPHWYSKFLSSGEIVSQERVTQQARQQLQQRLVGALVDGRRGDENLQYRLAGGVEHDPVDAIGGCPRRQPD